MKVVTNGIIEEERREGDHNKPLLIGSGTLVAYFVLFGYNSMITGFKNEIFYLLRGTYNDPFASLMGLILSGINLILLVFGLYFFIKGLRTFKKSRGKIQDRRLQTFIAFYVIFMILMSINNFVDSSSYFYETYIGDLSFITGWNIFYATVIAGHFLFVFIIMMIAIQTPLLRSRGLLDIKTSKKPVIHFFMSGLLVVCLFSIFYFYMTIICYLITSFLAAGVYLELFLKIKKSKQEINTKS